MNKEPDRVYINKVDREIYDKLKEVQELKNYDNKDLFFLAMMIGFTNDNNFSIDKKEGFVRTEYFSINEKAIINAITIYKNKNVDSIRNKEDVYKNAEEYANGGIKILKEKVYMGYGDFIKKIEGDIVKKVRSIING